MVGIQHARSSRLDRRNGSDAHSAILKRAIGHRWDLDGGVAHRSEKRNAVYHACVHRARLETLS